MASTVTSRLPEKTRLTSASATIRNSSAGEATKKATLARTSWAVRVRIRRCALSQPAAMTTQMVANPLSTPVTGTA
ncbi:Uncharacterised protein [Mycobacteroides abscessus subsp. abscessus]|nr:Uncharacterised protein [Mycobacteroides abscessus subsp. abscessus]